MNVALSTALSGISAANERLRAAASNIANLAASSQTRSSAEPTNVDKRPEVEVNPANGSWSSNRRPMPTWPTSRC